MVFQKQNCKYFLLLGYHLISLVEIIFYIVIKITKYSNLIFFSVHDSILCCFFSVHFVLFLFSQFLKM